MPPSVTFRTRFFPSGNVALRLGASGAVMLCVACGGQQSQPKPLGGMGPEMSTEESLAAPPIETVQAPITSLERQDVIDAVDAGLGTFLQDFATEPSLTEAGTFEGFKIVKVYDRKKYEGLGIGPGDVVTRINGMPIERPVEAYEAFVALKTAKSLDVEYLRGGRVMRLSLPIVGEGKSRGVKPTTTSPGDSSAEPASQAGAPNSAPSDEKKKPAPDVKTPR